MNSHEKNGASPAALEDSPTREYQILKAVNEALSNLLSTSNQEEALERSFKAVCEAIGCDGVYLFDDHQLEENKVIAKSCFGIRHEKDEWKILNPALFEFPLETDLLKSRVNSMLKEDATTIALCKDCPPGLNNLLKSLDVESYFTFRIVIDNNIWGGISFFSRQASTEWAQGLRQLLEPFVSSVGNFLTRKRAEQNLQTQRDYFRQIIDSMPNPIYAINREGDFTIVNRAMAKEFNMTPEEIIGKHIYSVNLDQEFSKKIHEEALEVLESQVAKLEILRKRKDFHGNLRFWQLSKVPIKKTDGQLEEVLTTFTDLTPIKRAEERLLEQKRLSESITSTIPDIILVVNLEKKEFTYNNFSDNSNVLGVERREIDNLFTFLVSRLHPEDRGQQMEFLGKLNEVTAHEAVEQYFRLQHKDGHWVHFYERAKVFSGISTGV